MTPIGAPTLTESDCLSSGSIAEAEVSLLEHALGAGGFDNITLVIVELARPVEPAE